MAAAAGVELTSTGEPVPISGTEAILELLQREQCILSYKTEDIITNYFDIQDRNLETIVQYNDEEVSLLVNSINRKPGLLDFFNVPTDILSFAVPKIRLFKQIINENGETSEDGEALEFRFDSFTSESSLSSITKEGMGRGHGVGIKSASWSFEGTNPEEITSFIKFNLKLFIQNMSDLVDGVDFQDDADPARRAVFGQQKPNLLQLLAAGVGGQADSAGNSTTYTVKAQVGWELDSTIDLGAFTSRTPDEINRIKNSITSTNKWLELFLYTSDISFGQDGTIEISLDYSAGLDEQLSDDSMNILAMDLEDGEETAIQSILRARKLDAESASSDDSSTDNTSSAEGEPERCQSGLRGPTEINNPNDPEESIPLTNAESVMLAAATDATESDQNIFNNYNTIFNTLLNSSKVYKLYIDEVLITGARFEPAGVPASDGGLGLAVQAISAGAGLIADALDSLPGESAIAAGARGLERTPQENINELTINSRLFTIQQLEAIPINRIEKIQFEDLPNVRPLEVDPTIEPPEPEAGDTSNDADQAQLRAVQEAAENVDYSIALQEALAVEYGDDGQFVTIEFFRLGDLLDQIILKLRDTEGSSLNIRNREAFTFISGIYTYVDGYGARKGVNYCDILVSVEKFREFFIEKVIRKLRVNYDLKRFILDMINTFSFLAGTGACMEGNSSPIRGETRPSFSVFQAPSIDFSNIGARVAEDYIGGVLPNIPFDAAALASGYGNIIDSRMSHLANEAFAAAMESEYLYGKEQVGRLSNYFAILSSNYSLSPPEGESQQKREMFDADRGIYHVKLGTDRGLLKNVNFRKDELPGRREQRMEEGGGMNLSVLREKYNAELSLFGCPFLYPGMYIYIDPSLIGLGFADQQSSIAQILGIGGYYFINKVSNSINESSEFETTLDLIWNTFGDGGVCPITIIESNVIFRGGWAPGSFRLPDGGTVPMGPDGGLALDEMTPGEMARDRGDPNAPLVDAMAGGTGLVPTRRFRPAPGVRFRHLD